MKQEASIRMCLPHTTALTETKQLATRTLTLCRRKHSLCIGCLQSCRGLFRRRPPFATATSLTLTQRKKKQESYKANPEKRVSVRESHNADVQSVRSTKRQRYQNHIDENRASKRQQYRNDIDENHACF